MSESNLKEKSLKTSFYDGIFASAMMGFTQDYFTPFLLLLGATARDVGMLTAFPNLFSSLIQLKSPDITERLKSRRRIINIFIFLQALMLLPMAIMAFMNIARPILFILLAVLFTAFGALTLPAWSSLMSDLVSENRRGEYFGWRNRTLGFILVGCAFSAGIILNIMKKFNAYNGFAIIFGCAFIFRLISWYFLTRMYEPPLTYKREHYFSFFDFISRAKESNFAKFVFSVSFMSFSVNLVSPFFAVLMLKDLHFDYITYTLVTLAATVMIYLMIQRWGTHADRVGNLKIIRLTSKLVSFIPLFWIISRNPVYLFLLQMASGLVWAGYNLCSANFIFDAVTPEKRTRCVAYFNVFNGLGICCGSLLGGFLVQRLPPFFGYKVLTLCVISSLLRFIVAFFMVQGLKEVRTVAKIKSADLFFSVIGVRPV